MEFLKHLWKEKFSEKDRIDRDARLALDVSFSLQQGLKKETIDEIFDILIDKADESEKKKLLYKKEVIKRAIEIVSSEGKF